MLDDCIRGLEDRVIPQRRRAPNAIGCVRSSAAVFGSAGPGPTCASAHHVIGQRDPAPPPREPPLPRLDPSTLYDTCCGCRVDESLRDIRYSGFRTDLSRCRTPPQRHEETHQGEGRHRRGTDRHHRFLRPECAALSRLLGLRWGLSPSARVDQHDHLRHVLCLAHVPNAATGCSQSLSAEWPRAGPVTDSPIG